MKFATLAATLAITSLWGLLYAQDGNWDTYLARYDKKPGSVLVDLDYINKSPNEGLPFLVVTGPKALHSDKDGIPDRDEIPMLEDILDATGNFITGVTAKALVGTFTYNTARVNYYYVKDTTGIRNAIARLYNRSFSNYNYVINIKRDAQWAAYRTFLYPDEPTLNWMENDKIITAMLERGDSLRDKREVNFELIFTSDSDREPLVNFAMKHAYSFDKSYISSATPYHLTLSRATYIRLEDIDTMTAEIRAEARLHRGLYTGWSTR